MSAASASASNGMRHGRLRRAVGALAVTAALGVLAGCGTAGLSERGEPLSIEQSEHLAQARFSLSAHDEFTAHVSVGAADATDHYEADLTVSSTDHVAWGTLHRGPADLAVDEPVLVAPGHIAVQSGGAWQVADASAYAALPIALSLVSDRPENAQLLRQSDARFLGTADLHGTDAAVFRIADENGDAGRSRVWLDDDGALLRLDDGGDSLVIEITDAAPEPRPEQLDEILGTGTGGQG